MENKTLLYAGMIAALVAFLAALMMGFGVPLPAGEVTWQPSYPPTALADFVRPITAYPDQMLRFFAADSLFVMSYLMVFAALYGVMPGRVRPLALVGFGAGILTALFDATENGFFITYALLARQATPLPDPPLTLIFMLSYLKWAASFTTLYAYGLVLPRNTRLSWVVDGLMLLFSLVGVLSIAWPGLTDLRGLFLLLGMALFAAYFWQQASRRQ